VPGFFGNFKPPLFHRFHAAAHKLPIANRFATHFNAKQVSVLTF
jgi:hypothetical protein